MRLTQSTFLVRIDVGNAAFDTGDCSELARILRDMADRIEDGSPEQLGRFQNVRDSNGNICGQFAIKPEGYEG